MRGWMFLCVCRADVVVHFVCADSVLCVCYAQMWLYVGVYKCLLFLSASVFAHECIFSFTSLCLCVGEFVCIFTIVEHLW